MSLNQSQQHNLKKVFPFKRFHRSCACFNFPLIYYWLSGLPNNISADLLNTSARLRMSFLFRWWRSPTAAFAARSCGAPWNTYKLYPPSQKQRKKKKSEDRVLRRMCLLFGRHVMIWDFLLYQTPETSDSSLIALLILPLKNLLVQVRSAFWMLSSHNKGEGNG